jgi:hypothetical protein
MDGKPFSQPSGLGGACIDAFGRSTCCDWFLAGKLMNSLHAERSAARRNRSINAHPTPVGSTDWQTIV